MHSCSVCGGWSGPGSGTGPGKPRYHGSPRILTGLLWTSLLVSLSEKNWIRPKIRPSWDINWTYKQKILSYLLLEFRITSKEVVVNVYYIIMALSTRGACRSSGSWNTVYFTNAAKNTPFDPHWEKQTLQRLAKSSSECLDFLDSTS